MMTFRILSAAVAAQLMLGAGAMAQSGLEVKTAGYQLKNRSSYQAPAETRPPFWPIGWTKRQAGAPTLEQPVAPKVTVDPALFSVTSIIMGRPSFAVINSISYAEGENVRIPRTKDGGPVLPAGTRVRLARITDGSAILEVAGQSTEIPMRRPQIGGAKVESTTSLDLLKPVSER